MPIPERHNSGAVNKKVLLVDLDAQESLASFVGYYLLLLLHRGMRRGEMIALR